MVLSYNISKGKLEIIEEYIKNKNFQLAKVELGKFYEDLKETAKNIADILNFLENSSISIKKKIYSLIYYYLYDLEIMDEEGVFLRVVDHIGNKEFVKESLWARIKNCNIKSLEEEIKKIDKILNILSLIFNFLDYKIHKCGRKIDIYEIKKELKQI